MINCLSLVLPIFCGIKCDNRDSGLIVRYMHMIGLESYDDGFGLFRSVFFLTEQGKQYAVIEKCRNELGLEIWLEEGHGAAEEIWEVRKPKNKKLVLRFETAEGQNPWREFDSRSILKLAYDDVARKCKLRKTDRIVKCEYILCPWISRKLKRLETVRGEFFVMRGSEMLELPFIYDR